MGTFYGSRRMTTLRVVLFGVIVALVAWPLGPVRQASADPVVTINKRVAVLLVNFARQPSEPWTKEFVEDMYFGPTNSVASYYAELSNGAMEITGSVFGYLTVTSSLTSCARKTWAAAARSKATAAGINLSGYTNIVYAFPYQPRCWWAGLAVGGPRSRQAHNWINGLMSLHVAIHELGHSFGAGHAGTLICTRDGQRVAYSATCRTYAYGDPFDPMGYEGQRHMQAWLRQQIGLLSSSEVVTVSENGVYALSPGELSGDDPRMLLVPRPDGGNYAIDLRQPYGEYDDFPADSPVVTGVSIRLVRGGGAPTRLIDTKPETCTFQDAPLGVGRTFVDGANRIAITTVSIGSTGAEVRVETNFRGAAPPIPAAPSAISDTSPPTAPTALRADLITARSAAVTWAAADDDVGIRRYQVTAGGVSLGTTCDLMLDNIKVRDGRSYEFSVQAVDSTGNVGPQGQINMWIPDVTPPTSPRRLSGRGTGSTISLRWLTATDNVAVDRYRLSRNGVVIADLEPGITSYSDGSLARGRTYRYILAAIDAARNSSTPVGVSVALR